MKDATYSRVSTQHREQKPEVQAQCLWRYCRLRSGRRFLHQISTEVRLLSIIFLFFNFAWAGPIDPKTQATYFYGSEPTALTGTIQTIIFPGPPNYDSIKAGDKPESCLILFLDKPIAVLQKNGRKEELDDPYRDVRKIQLVLYSDRKIKLIENKHVRVTGTFFSAHTGHHHTSVLLEVERIEKLK